MPRFTLQTFEDDVIDRLARIEEHTAQTAAAMADHETRIRTVEKRQWLFAGGTGLLSALLMKLGLGIHS